MWRRLLVTEDSWPLFVQRVVVGIVMFPHGAQKLFGWFGGYGFSGTIAGMGKMLHIPAWLVFLDIMAESLGAVALAFGFATRIASFGITVAMLVAVFTVHLHNGLFMNWTGAQHGEGFEYHLLLLALTIPLILKGGGLCSVDRALTRR